MKAFYYKSSLYFTLLALLFLNMSTYAAAKQKNNVLIICIDDLRNQLGCLGNEYMHTPHLDKLSEKTRLFKRHYVQAPTCGASRYAFLIGQYNKMANGKNTNMGLMIRSEQLKKAPDTVSPSMPAWFRQNGYETISIGKVSHHPGGMGGRNWSDENMLEMPNSWDKCLQPLGKWPHPSGVMHSLSNGQYRKTKKDYPVYESYDGDDESYNDGLIAKEAVEHIRSLANSDKPFLLAVGFIKPHLPFGAPASYMKPYLNSKVPKPSYPNKPSYRTTWHNSGEFRSYHRWNKEPNTDEAFALELRKHYAACISYVDQMVGKVIDELENQGLDKNTTVVLWSDHGWLLGDHGIWGKHCLFEEALLSPLMIGYPNMPKKGIPTESLVESVDVFPTLCEISGIPVPDKISGKSLMPVLEDPTTKNKYAVSYWKSGATTIRTETHRLILHRDGYVELYDHTSPEKETKNIAGSHQEIVKSLSSVLKEKLPMYFNP